MEGWVDLSTAVSVQPVPKAAYRSDFRENTNFCPQHDSNLGPLAQQASVLPLDHWDHCNVITHDIKTKLRMMTHDNDSQIFLVTVTIMLMTILYRLDKTSKNSDALNKQHRHLCANCKVSSFGRHTEAKALTSLSDGLVDDVWLRKGFNVNHCFINWTKHALPKRHENWQQQMWHRTAFAALAKLYS